MENFLKRIIRGEFVILFEGLNRDAQSGTDMVIELGIRNKKHGLRIEEKYYIIILKKMDNLKYYKRMLKAIFYRFRKKTGLIFYTRKQHYRCQYKVSVVSKLGVNKKVYIVAPLPLETVYQNIVKKPSISPEPIFVNSDAGYFVWSIDSINEKGFLGENNFETVILPRFTTLPDLKLKPVTSEDKQFVAPNAFITPSDPHIKNQAEKIYTEGDTFKTLSKKINEHVKNLSYGEPITGLYSAIDAVTLPQVDCGGFSSYFMSLAIALGIPAKILLGFTAGYQKNNMHAWLELKAPDGEWLPFDPSMEKLFDEGRGWQSGRAGFVGSDRIVFSTGCDLKLPLYENGPIVNIDILQNGMIFDEQGKLQKDFKITTTLETITL